MNLVRFKILLVALSLFVFIILISPPASAYQSSPHQSLVPIGSEDAITYEGLVLAAKNKLVNGVIRILILPIAEASDPQEISIPERTAIVQKTERLRLSIQDTCESMQPETIPCEVILAPVITRSDAVLPTTSELLDQSYSAILISGEDPKIAGQVIGGTPVDQELNEAYQEGVIISGLEGSENLLSLAMIGGQKQQFTTQDTLHFGTVDIWNSSEEHGFIFGVKDAVIDHNLIFGDNFGRLLNSITLPDTPNVGIGTEENTGFLIENNLFVSSAFGSNNITLLDGETYYSSGTVKYVGCEFQLECYPVLSLRNVLVHMIAPGMGSYDLETRHHSLADPMDNLARNFEDLLLPSNAAPLYLSASLSSPMDQNRVIEHYLSLSKDVDSGYVLLIAGTQDDPVAQDKIGNYRSALGPDLEVIIIPPDTPSSIENLDRMKGIVLEAVSGATFSSSTLNTVQTAWRSGVPVLAVGEATKQIGNFYIPRTEFGMVSPAISSKIIPSLHVGQVDLFPGAGWIDVSIQDDVLVDSNMGNLFALAYNHPEQLAIGLTRDAALIISEDGAEVVGENAIINLDFSQATLALGDNDAIVFANGLLDSFAPGEKVEPGTINNIPQSPPATPLIQTLTPTPSPTLTLTPTSTPTLSPTLPPPTLTPTKTKRPTVTPLPIPPPSDPVSLQWIVAFGVLIVVVILFGFLMNRRRL